MKIVRVMNMRETALTNYVSPLSCNPKTHNEKCASPMVIDILKFKIFFWPKSLCALLTY